METDTSTTIILSIISTIIAGLSLAISGYALYLTRKDKQPKIKIEGEFSETVTVGNKTYIDGQISGTISNTGEIPIYITQIQFNIYSSLDKDISFLDKLYFEKGLLLDNEKPPQRLEPKQQLQLDTYLSAEEEENIVEIAREQIAKTNHDRAIATITAHDGTHNTYERQVEIKLFNPPWLPTSSQE